MKRGIFLTLDAVAAILILFTVVLVSFSYFWGAPQSANFGGQNLRLSAQDAATVMLKSGYLTAPLLSQNRSDTSGIREVLAATPSSLCMQVTGHGLVMPDGLVGYWKFDEDSGAAASDYSGFGNHATLRSSGSAPTFIEGGRSSRSILFDGTNYASVQHSSILAPAGQITVAAWVYNSNWQTCDCDAFTFVSKKESGGYALAMNDEVDNPTGAFEFDVRRGGAYLTPNFTIGLLGQGWRQLVGTYDGRYAKLYADGVLLSTVDGGSESPITYAYNNSLIFGAEASGVETPSGRYFNGTMDEVRIYNRALSASEISQLYSNPSNLLYAVDKPGCTYGGGELQTITVPLSYNQDQLENRNYYSVVKAWVKGVR